MATGPHPSDTNLAYLSADVEYHYASAHRLGNTVVMLVPLPSGRYAVMNSARQIQGFVHADQAVAVAAAVRVPPEPATTQAGKWIFTGPRLVTDIDL